MVVALQPFLLISHKKRPISIRNQPYIAEFLDIFLISIIFVFHFSSYVITLMLLDVDVMMSSNP